MYSICAKNPILSTVTDQLWFNYFRRTILWGRSTNKTGRATEGATFAAGAMYSICAKKPIFSTITDQLRIRHLCLLSRGTVGVGWMAPVVVRTAEAPVAVRAARPVSVGTGVVVVVVLDGWAIVSSWSAPDTV